MGKNREDDKRSLLLYIIAIIVIAVLIFVSYAAKEGLIPGLGNLNTPVGISESKKYPFSVHYLNVGKADCIYISYEGFDVLIDSGDSDDSSTILTYLKKCKVDDLELVIATHPDKDHIGSMTSIINTYDIDEFWFYDYPESQLPDSNVYAMMARSLIDKNVNVVSPNVGYSYVYEDLKIDVLSPMKCYNNENDNSIVVKMTYKDIEYLFMGDASDDVEKDLLESNADLSADVLKVGHHGSKSSSCEEFLSAVQPQISVISVSDVQHNLPSKSVIKRFDEMGLKYYRTDECGNVVVATNGKDLALILEKNT